MRQLDWSEPGLQAIAQLLAVRAGLSFREGQRDSIEKAMRQAMLQTGSPNLSSYLRRLETDPKLVDDLLVETTVGETYFFRDPRQFTFLKTRVLPELSRRRSSHQNIRFWSAGCASGEEAYSLAILAAKQGLLDRVSVLGTDISRTALQRAEQGCYREWSLRGAGEELAKSHLIHRSDRYEVRPEIRRAVHFEYLNLALDNYPSFATGTRGVDVILCRNVFIYFDPETIRNVVARFHRSLSEGGWLITASSDPPIHEFGIFEVVATDEGMFLHKQSDMESLDRVPVAAPPLLPEAVAAYPAFEPPAEPAAIAPDPPREAAPAAVNLAEARKALEAGDYHTAAHLAARLPEDTEAAIIRVKALANHDIAEADRVCSEAAHLHPLSAELHYLHGVLLMELNRHADAALAFNRVLFLDRSIALAHFSLGTALRTLGESQRARRAFTSAHELCVSLPPGFPLALGDEDRAGDLLEAAKSQIEMLDETSGVSR